MEQTTLFEQMGGAQTIRRIVEAFYPRVQEEPDIKDLFPEDIMPVMERQYLFLSQFFGGPALYNEKHGHPMLRARHQPFPINVRRAQAWLRCMMAAIDEVGLEPAVREQVVQRLAFTAQHMINTQEN